MPVLVVDSSAWIEYARNSPLAEEVEAHLEAGDEVKTPATALAEIVEHGKRVGRDVSPLLREVRAFAQVVPIDSQMALLAGEINAERKVAKGAKWGMLDSFALALARRDDGEVLAIDSDFRDLDEAIVPKRDGSVKRSRRVHDDEVP